MMIARHLRSIRPPCGALRRGLLIVLACVLHPLTGLGEKESHGSERMTHAAYAVGDRLRSMTQIEKTNFDAFDFIYLVAGPEWKAADFGDTKKSAMQRLVKGHAYPGGDAGRALAPAFITHAHAAGTRVLLSLPGGTEFRLLAGVPAMRTVFAEVMAAFVQKHGYDGIEIDWEGEDLRLDLHAALMNDLRGALDALQTKERRYMLTTALHTYHPIPPSVAAAWRQSLDWINLMSYDLGGGVWGRIATHNTPLPVIQEHTVRYYEQAGIPPEKLCLGLANYGFIYRGLKPGEASPAGLATQGSYFLHTQLADLLAAGWAERYDEQAQAPYYVSPDGEDFVTVDNLRSLREKVNWARQRGYRGLFWWELHCDLVPADGEERFNRHALIDSVARQLGRRITQHPAPLE